jgi:hypothetical protein
MASVRFGRLTSKLLDQSRQVLVIRPDDRQPLGVSERGGRISGGAAERNQRRQDIAVGRMMGESFLQ